MEAVQNLPPHQQQAFMKEMELLQVKDSLTYVRIYIDTMSICDKYECLCVCLWLGLVMIATVVR
jgi:hypothetical protein